MMNKKHCTNMGFGYLSDEIDAYSDHACGLSEGTHYIHDNRLFIWRDGAKGLEQHIKELEAENESLSERARQWDMHNCTTHAMNLVQENARLKEQPQELEKRIAELETELANAIQSGDENQAQIPDAILERDKLKDENTRLKEQLEQQAKMLDYYRINDE